MTPRDEETFDRLYIAWLQCGCDTHPVNEEFERMWRHTAQKKTPETCPHGKTPLTCADCYLRGNSYLN